MTTSTDLRQALRPQDRLREKLKQELSEGRWPLGTTLPPTRELARQYQVSFNTVLQVLHQLQAAGMVELRPRSGVIVLNTGTEAPSARQSTFVGVLGDVTPRTEPGQWWGSTIYSAIHEHVVQAGYDTLLLGNDLPHDDASHTSLITKLESMREGLAGLIIASSAELMRRMLDAFDRLDVPWVTLNQSDDACFENFVAADNQRDSCRVGRLFARLGIANTLVLHTDLIPSGSIVEKVNGFVGGYIFEGMPLGGIQFLNCGGVEHSLGYTHVKQYLEANPKYRPQGIFASGDNLAVGAIQACQEMGLSVPDDVRVVGSTGLEASGYTNPSLTVLAQPMAEMGRAMVSMLMEMSRKKVSRVTGRRVPCVFTPRDSLQAPRDLLIELGLG